MSKIRFFDNKEEKLSNKKIYEEPKIIHEQQIEISAGGCNLEPGNTACEQTGYVTLTS